MPRTSTPRINRSSRFRGSTRYVTANGRAASPGGDFDCRPRRSGNVPRAVEPRGRSMHGAMSRRICSRTTRRAGSMALNVRARDRLTASVCTTSARTSTSGAAIGTPRSTTPFRLSGTPAGRRVARAVCRVADHGVIRSRSAAVPPGRAFRPSFATQTMAFGSRRDQRPLVESSQSRFFRASVSKRSNSASVK